MPPKKRPPPEDPSSSRQVRPRLSPEVPGLPTPDDALSADSRSVVDPYSVPDSAAPSTSLPAEKKVPAGPANPGVIRKRGNNVLSRLPSDSDALDAFAKLRKDDNLTDEEAFLKFIKTYDVSLTTLNRISSNVYPSLLYGQLIWVAFLIVYC